MGSELLISAEGESIRDMQNQTGCKINVSPDNGRGVEREIGLVGTRQAVEAAKRAIMEKVDAVVSLSLIDHSSVMLTTVSVLAYRVVKVATVAMTTQIDTRHSPLPILPLVFPQDRRLAILSLVCQQDHRPNPLRQARHPR